MVITHTEDLALAEEHPVDIAIVLDGDQSVEGAPSSEWPIHDHDLG